MAVEAQRPAAPARPRPRREREEELLVWPDLVFVEFIAAVLFSITFLILSVLINAPLLNRANPDVTPNPSKAPWYFLNLQELLLHMDAAWAGVILPTIALVFFAAIPYIDRSREGQGVWFGTKYSVRLTVIAAIYAIAVSWMLVIFDAGDQTRTEYLTRWIPPCDPAAEHQGWPCLFTEEGARHLGIVSTKDVAQRLEFSAPFPNILGVDDRWLDWPQDFTDVTLVLGYEMDIPALMTGQIIPIVTIIFFALLILYIMFRVGWMRTRRDVFIVMFTAVMASYLTLSIIGSFFRGPGQALVWPWEIRVDEG
jgi:hypothetical protein